MVRAGGEGVDEGATKVTRTLLINGSIEICQDLPLIGKQVTRRLVPRIRMTFDSMCPSSSP